MQLHRTLRHALIAALATLAACEPKAAPPAPAPLVDEAMILDGVPIPRAPLEAAIPVLRAASPNTGRNTTARFILDRHLVPMVFARREFADRRAEQRRRAEALGKLLGPSAGSADLTERTVGLLGGEILKDVSRADLPVPERMWLFEDENLGRVSPMLETAQGFSFVAASDKRPGITKAFDVVDAVVVRFYTHPGKEYAEWLRSLRRRLGSLPEEKIRVHPDFVDALPHWRSAAK